MLTTDVLDNTLEQIEAPMWPLIRVYHTGSWTNPYAETFGPDGIVPTHIHIYRLDVFQKALREHALTIPDTVRTFSES